MRYTSPVKKVKVAAIIAEFNPLHDGHRFIIDEARRQTGCSHVLIVQSGNFTQRAQPAIEEKHKRAERAINAGADAVVEIPNAFATSNAEVFAKAGVKIATSFAHVTHLVFGTESSDLTLLRLIASTQVKRQMDFEKYMTTHLKKGISFDNARCEVIKKLLPQISANLIEKTMNTPNNILGIEYLKELVRLKSKVKPIGVQRIDGVSATKIRAQIIAQEQHSPNCEKTPLRDMYNAFGSIALFSAMTRLDTNIYNSNTELVNLFQNVHPVTYEQLQKETPTKRFSISRISRLALHSALGITKADIDYLYKHDWLPYANLIAINLEASDLFSAMCLNSKTPLLVRGNKIRPAKTAYYLRLREIDRKTELLYEAITGIRHDPRPAFVIRKGPEQLTFGD